MNFDGSNKIEFLIIPELIRAILRFCYFSFELCLPFDFLIRLVFSRPEFLDLLRKLLLILAVLLKFVTVV